MGPRLLMICLALGSLGSLSSSLSLAQNAPGNGGLRRESSFPAIAEQAWTGARLADGQPDVQGHWSNTIGNHSNFTDPQGRQPGAAERARPERAAERPRSERAPSRVSDPADGQVPFLPWAREAQQDFAANFANPKQPQYIEPLARCAPGGVPKSFMWHGFEIRQYPGYVLFLFDSGSRIVHLDDKPHLPDNIKLWNAGSRGHWEGNTLVVDVRNSNGKALFGRTGEFSGENTQVAERYVFAPNGQRFNYIATFTDPSIYSRPWTATIPVRRYTEADAPDGWHFQTTLANHAGSERIIEREERICHENNGGFGGVATARR
ncbi:hypothetical protein [Paucibacter sp. Y2R2-4]|uniref:hypothetical protein n=1 Tax=Paucibacter sp. Y2R2-4 TaxID=2893553 RepID=UPI0021E372F9|nr:hypothetical protein [Paucibacter sp. Y2R2-4]MCV2348303.1 hypothetical protein [Paucibacter sp. Y2R2-4]